MRKKVYEVIQQCNMSLTGSDLYFPHEKGSLHKKSVSEKWYMGQLNKFDDFSFDPIYADDFGPFCITTMRQT